MRYSLITLVFALAIARADCAINGTTIRDQQVNSVGWAFAAVALVENQFNRQTCENLTLSVEQVIDRAPSHCKPSLQCALHYMHIEGIMYEKDYPYSRGVHTTQKYDASKLAPIAITEPFQVCAEGTNISRKMDCLEEYLPNHSAATTICLDPFDGYFNYSEISASDICYKLNHSFALLYPLRLPASLAIYFQNSSGLIWGDRGIGRFIFTKNDRRINADPRDFLANLWSVNVTRENRTDSSSSASAQGSASVSSSASDGVPDNASGSESDSQSNGAIKNQVARAFPLMHAMIAIACACIFA